MKKILLLILLLPVWQWTQGQNYKFGKVSVAELKEKSYPGDPSVPAAVLYSDANVYIDVSSKYGFVLKKEYFVRLKIYKKEGFDYATVEIPLYWHNATRESVDGLKAVTYNLVNGKIQKTKLDNAKVYYEKTSDYIKTKKFTLPNLKPGSVVEWKYTLTSPFIRFSGEVDLQYDIPAKKIHALISYPEWFKVRYFFKRGTDVQLKQYTSRRKLSGYIHDVRVIEDVDENVYEITASDVPALHEEPYAGNMENFRYGIKFEVAGIEYKNNVKYFSVTWDDVAKYAYTRAFLDELNRKKYFKKDLDQLLVGAKTLEDKLKKIFEFAKHKIKSNGRDGLFPDKGVVMAYAKGAGDPSEVNLNLINMLNGADIKAYPVLVSTIDNGIPLFPSTQAFNHVIAGVPTNQGLILLDATDPYATLHVLPTKDLNFFGLLVEDMDKSMKVELFPKTDSKDMYNVNVSFDGTDFSGISIRKMDNFFAYKYRKKLAQKHDEERSKWLQNQYPDLDILKSRFNGLKKPYAIASEMFQFETDAYAEEVGGKTYISPLLHLRMKKNPFASPERKFPVFFNFPRSIIKTVNITLPQGAKVVSVPGDVKFVFGDNTGIYQYKVIQNGNKIQIQSIYQMSVPVVPAKDYKELREFFDKIVKKQAEKIVIQQ